MIADEVCAGVVTYNPDLDVLKKNLESLCPQVKVIYVVDNGSKNVVYISIHIDAMGADGKWHDANGWSVRVSPNASNNSKILANCLYDAAKSYGLKMRQPTPAQKYWPQSLYVLNSTNCPAVLTENLFQDNRKDVDFLLSEEGKHTIARLHVEGIIKYIEKI